MTPKYATVSETEVHFPQRSELIDLIREMQVPTRIAGCRVVESALVRGRWCRLFLAEQVRRRRGRVEAFLELAPPCFPRSSCFFLYNSVIS